MSDTSQGPGWWLASDGKWYPPYPPHAQPMPPPFVPPMPTNGMATAGFVCGLIGFLLCLIPFGVFFGGVLAVLGIVFGVVGRARVREQRAPGGGLAIAGMALSVLGLIIGVLWLVAIGGAFRTIHNQVTIHPGDVAITQQSCGRSAIGELEASGYVTNTTGTSKALVFVHVKAIDASGRVVGSAEDYVGQIAPHEQRAYTATGTVDDKTVESFTCTVTVG